MKIPFELTPGGSALCLLSASAGYFVWGGLRGALVGFVCATATVAVVTLREIMRNL